MNVDDKTPSCYFEIRVALKNLSFLLEEFQIIQTLSRIFLLQQMLLHNRSIGMLNYYLHHK